VLSETWVVLASPEAVRDVFAHGPEELDSGVANYALRPMLGTRSVLLLDGTEHLRRRKLVPPPFHGERMRAYEGLIRDATRDRRLAARRGSAHAAADAGDHLPRDPARRVRVEEGPRLKRLGAILRR
jgi:cytochrome P450